MREFEQSIHEYVVRCSEFSKGHWQLEGDTEQLSACVTVMGQMSVVKSINNSGGRSVMTSCVLGLGSWVLDLM